MDNVRPQDLPGFLDPLLDYLAHNLPSPLYDALFTTFSYLLMLASGLFSFISALPSLKPWEWDAQAILPPLIMFLTAYYTLVSLYRSTSFMVRTVFLVLKWGLILGLLGASAGWIADWNGNNNGPADVLNAFREGLHGQDVGDSRARTTRTPRARPHMYESFTAHEQWRYSEEQARRAEQADAPSDAQRFIESVAGLAVRAVGDFGYDLLSNARGVFDSMTNSVNSDETNKGGSTSARQTRKQPHRKVKTSTRRKTASR